MKISISNIGWNKEIDDTVLSFLKDEGYDAIEIAPTIILENPYDNLPKIKEYYQNLKKRYSLKISSMQSIWYGKMGNIFNENDRKDLFEYTKKAILFAEAINCHNLVFGCPKNRYLLENHQEDEVISFFKELGDFAYRHHTIISLEANPVIYNTNFLNRTIDAFNYARKINSKGIKVNVDLGTIIYNKEPLDDVKNNFDLINHVHISEPYLVKIERRKVHYDLIDFLKKIKYNNYISIEMKDLNDITSLKEIILYLKDLRG